MSSGFGRVGHHVLMFAHCPMVVGHLCPQVSLFLLREASQDLSPSLPSRRSVFGDREHLCPHHPVLLTPEGSAAQRDVHEHRRDAGGGGDAEDQISLSDHSTEFVVLSHSTFKMKSQACSGSFAWKCFRISFQDDPIDDYVIDHYHFIPWQ